MTKEWKFEQYLDNDGRPAFKEVLYIDGVRTNKCRKEVFDVDVYCGDDNDDIMIKNFLYKFRAFVDDDHHVRSVCDYSISIFHYEEYTEDE